MVAAFVLKLAAGIALMWLLMPRREVTDGFFRIQMLVLLGLSVLGLLALDVTTLTSGATSVSMQDLLQSEALLRWFRGLWLMAAVTSYLGHIFWKLGRRVPGRICIFVIAAVTLGGLGLHSWRVVTDTPRWLQAGSELSSAAVLGATLTGMLLGHWYLTTPTMSIQPLSWFTRTLLVSAVIRLVWTILTALVVSFPASVSSTTQLWIGIRIAGGVIAPAVAAVMVLRILKYRNTQSATGVLFAALILVFMGETMASLLERELQLSL